ncbi:glycerate kinase [Aestuariibius sp. 2305UL40-4]|uniref:glycerate kinase type-2 family protein n=1 Tax=Aestuariibius violaceus TaxID=3234132 RepID=UPI00345F0D7E
MSFPEPSTFLRQLFDEAVAVADPMRVVPAALPPKPDGRIVVVGAGKASARMAEAVESVWGPCEGLVITRYGYRRPTAGIEIIEAAHPVPDQAGADATQRMLKLLGSTGAGDLVLALISGGGSALLTAPASDITLDEKQAVTEALLRSGAPIDRMNIVRKHLSEVKGGQLSAAAYPATVFSLLISDVPGDDPASIASGPTVGETSTSADARQILEEFKIDMPDSVTEHLSRETGVISPGAQELESTTNIVVAAPSKSLEAAARLARDRGVAVRILGDALEGEARELAATQVETARGIQAGMTVGEAPVLLLSGGECTVSGRDRGIGGPNAEFALAAAIALDGADGIHAIACDTDGVDGAAEVAGACISPSTLAKAKKLGADPAEALNTHDSHTFFARLGDQIVTGPTLTNVNDFRAFLIEPTRR